MSVSGVLELVAWVLVVGMCAAMVVHHTANQMRGRNAPWVWLLGVMTARVGADAVAHQGALPSAPLPVAAVLGLGGLALAVAGLATTWRQWTRRGIPRIAKGELPPGFPLMLMWIVGFGVVSTTAMSAGGLAGALAFSVLLVGGFAPFVLPFLVAKRLRRTTQERPTAADTLLP